MEALERRIWAAEQSACTVCRAQLEAPPPKLPISMRWRWKYGIYMGDRGSLPAMSNLIPLSGQDDAGMATTGTPVGEAVPGRWHCRTLLRFASCDNLTYQLLSGNTKAEYAGTATWLHTLYRQMHRFRLPPSWVIAWYHCRQSGPSIL